MIMARHRDLESKINSATGFLNTLSLGTTLLSGVLLFTPYQSVGYIGVGTGVGAFTASVVSKKKYFEAAKQHIDSLEKHHRTEMGLQNELLLLKDNEIYTLKTDNSQRFKKIETLTQELNQSGNQVAQLQNQIETLSQHNQLQKQRIERVTGELDRLITLARTAVEESLDEWDSRLNSLVATKKELYPKLSERLTELLREAQNSIADYRAKLSETPNKWDSLADLLSLYYCVNDDLGRVRSKAIQALAKLSNQETLLELQEYQDAIQEWEEAKLIPRSKVEGLIAKYEAMLSEFRTDLNQRFENAQSIANAMEGELSKDNEFFLRLRMKIQELEEKVNVLSKPLEWRPATRADMRVANIIIRYFHQLGVILDRAGTEYKSYEAKLWFLPDRTGRLVLADELNDHSDKLQALCHTLNAPKFALEPESGLLSVVVQLAKKPATNTSDQAKRLLTPLDEVVKKLVDNLSHKPTIRVMGATGEGKGVMVRYLLKFILASNTWYCRLHDPQHGSSEDHWGIPKVSTSGSELKQALKDIESQMIHREANGWSVTTLDTLDEIDTHLEKKEKKESFIDLVSRIRHLGMKLILIGQNPKVGRAGFEWSDMQQMNCVYMGASAFDAIETNPQLKPRKDKLTKDYITLSEHYEKVNEGLSDGEKYLFGLVVIPGKTPLWIELPRPDSIEITCDETLLGKTFLISDSLKELVNPKNSADSAGNSGKTNRNLTPSAEAVTVTNQGLSAIDGTADYVGVAGTTGKAGNSGKPTCKKHPSAELRIQKDGRPYCSSCRKRLAKSDVEYR
jgi:hypothetical protein